MKSRWRAYLATAVVGSKPSTAENRSDVAPIGDIEIIGIHSDHLGTALRASQFGKIFLETIGISIAVGTVLGALTLPFNDQLGNHLTNPADGASKGAAIGYGGLVFEVGLSPRRSPDATNVHHLNSVLESATRAIEDHGPAFARSDLASLKSATVYLARSWTPVVSLNR